MWSEVCKNTIEQHICSSLQSSVELDEQQETRHTASGENGTTSSCHRTPPLYSGSEGTATSNQEQSDDAAVIMRVASQVAEEQLLAEHASQNIWQLQLRDLRRVCEECIPWPDTRLPEQHNTKSLQWYQYYLLLTTIHYITPRACTDTSTTHYHTLHSTAPRTYSDTRINYYLSAYYDRYTTCILHNTVQYRLLLMSCCTVHVNNNRFLHLVSWWCVTCHVMMSCYTVHSTHRK